MVIAFNPEHNFPQQEGRGSGLLHAPGIRLGVGFGGWLQ
jgi:hypothetical protein